MVAICIVHNRCISPWLDNLLMSIDTSYPIIITNHSGWMLPSIQDTFKNTPFDEIFFLNESMLVKDNSIWELVFEKYKGQSVAVGKDFLMYLGKYRREIIEQTHFPIIANKKDDVTLGEGAWNEEYRMLDPDFVTIDPMTDTHEKFEQKNGRRNMVLENKYFIKWKHHWDVGMIDD